jgi:hypothetical protein
LGDDGDGFQPDIHGKRRHVALHLFFPDDQFFNFAADADQSAAADKPRKDSRVDDAFAAMASSAMPTKAPPETTRAPKDWLPWADVRGSGIDRWGSASGSSEAQLYMAGRSIRSSA